MEELLKEIRDIMAEIRDLMKASKEAQEKAMAEAQKQAADARKIMEGMFPGLSAIGAAPNPLRRKDHGE